MSTRSYDRRGKLAKAFPIETVGGVKLTYPFAANSYYYNRDRKLRFPSDLSTVQMEFSGKVQSVEDLQALLANIPEQTKLTITVEGKFNRPTSQEQVQAVLDHDEAEKARKIRDKALAAKRLREARKEEAEWREQRRLNTVGDALMVLKNHGLKVVTVDERN